MPLPKPFYVYLRWHFCFSLHAKRTSSVPILQIQGGINVVSARLWKQLLFSCQVSKSGIEFLISAVSWFCRPYLGKTWRPPLCEWQQISALSLHSPRSRKIQYLAYLRDQNLALWGRWRGRGTRSARGRGAAACWPIDTPVPGCEMGYHARSGLWTEKQIEETAF